MKLGFIKTDKININIMVYDFENNVKLSYFTSVSLEWEEGKSVSLFYWPNIDSFCYLDLNPECLQPLWKVNTNKAGKSLA